MADETVGYIKVGGYFPHAPTPPVSDETDTTSEVARLLGEHPGWRFRAEEPGDWYVCSGCGTELETLRSAFPQEFYEHQATTLAEAGLLRDGGSR